MASADIPEDPVTQRLVYRYAWRSPLTSDDNLALFRVYDGGLTSHHDRTGEHHIHSAVGWFENRAVVQMPATADEVGRWDAAAVAHWSVLWRAGQLVSAARRRRHRWDGYTWLPFVRRVLEAGVQRAMRECAERVNAAWTAYRPTFEEVRGRWDRQAAARQAELDAHRFDRPKPQGLRRSGGVGDGDDPAGGRCAGVGRRTGRQPVRRGHPQAPARLEADL